MNPIEERKTAVEAILAKIGQAHVLRWWPELKTCQQQCSKRRLWQGVWAKAASDLLWSSVGKSRAAIGVVKVLFDEKANRPATRFALMLSSWA